MTSLFCRVGHTFLFAGINLFNLPCRSGCGANWVYQTIEQIRGLRSIKQMPLSPPRTRIEEVQC